MIIRRFYVPIVEQLFHRRGALIIDGVTRDLTRRRKNKKLWDMGLDSDLLERCFKQEIDKMT